MFARKSIAIALAMTIAALSGGFVATSSAQAADDCQVTITGGDVTALTSALNDATKTVICVSGEFTFTDVWIYPASREVLTIKGSPTATFKTIAYNSMVQSYILITTGGEADSGILNLNIENINFESTQQQSSALLTQNLTIKNSTFKNFSSVSSGGAIFSETGNIKVTDSLFLNNTAGAYGGAISLRNGANIGTGATIEITNSTFTGNTAPGGYEGGAIYVQNGSLKVYTSTFDSNSSTETGGAIYVQNSSSREVTIDASTFSNNTASYNGGAVGVDGSYAYFNNSTFYSNAATNGYGGAIYVLNGGKVTFSTFLNNSATEVGGTSIYKADSASTFTVGASIFASSITDPELVSSVPNDPKFVDQGANLFKNASPAEANFITSSSGFFVDDSRYGITVSQLFGNANPELADNGGPTKTIALLQGSVAINKAEPEDSNNASYASKDQRGYDRKGAYDSGAFEFGATATVVVTPPTQNSTPATTTSTASATTLATTTQTLAATGSSTSTWGLGALAGLITVLGVSILRSASRSSKN